MPAIGNAQTFQKAAPPRPAKPAARPVPTFADQQHGAGVIPTPRPAASRPSSAYTAPAPRTVVAGANPHGAGTLPKVTPGATQPQGAYQNPQSYADTVLKVFNAQPPAQQRAVIRGALKNPSTAESKILLQHVKQQSAGSSRFLAAIMGPGQAAVQAFESSGGTLDTIAGNTLKDAINLPAETLSTVAAGYTGLNDILQGHVGKGAGELYNTGVKPYVNLAEHPVKSFIQHPLDTGLMVSGLGHGLTRLAAAPVRAFAPESALGRMVSTQREGVALTGNLTKERPPYSKSPSIKAGQVAVEKALYKRAPTGELVPKSEQLRVRQVNQGVGELVGTQERIRRVNRAEAHAARSEAIAPSLARRAARNVKTALAFNPKQAAIPGADVLARIADGTIRRPDTIVADLQKHLEQVSANRPHLLGDPQALKAHDAYVKQLSDALKNKAFLKNPARAFAAAEAYAKDYAPVEAHAGRSGHFGTMTAEQLQRRALLHYAVTHMGARLDEAGRLVVDRPVRMIAGARQTPVPAEPPTETLPLANDQILAHLRGPEGTGGRVPAFTSDRVRFDAEKRARQANYVSSARRPRPNVQKNTLYAYTHGLTEPGHSALTEQHVLMQGVVDAHRAQNAYLETLATQKPGGGYWSTYEAAKRNAPEGYVPINTSEVFHPQASLDQAMQDVAPATIEEEAHRRSLDLSARLQPGTKGRWAIIDQRALKALNDHQNLISPNPLLRTIRGLNNQFRTVALSTSAKHVPGVAQENLIRDIGHGVGFRSWITGRRMLAKAEELRPEAGKQVRTSLTGGQVAGMTEAGKTYTVSDHWYGTNVHPVLKGMEAMFKAPGARQARTMWRAWTKFAIGQTKHLLEQQHQIAGVGKAALREHGYAEAAKTDGFMGLVHRAFGLHGKMLEDATKGLFDPAKARQMRATINQMYGKWTDLSPSAQTALMFSPFGLWWANSVRFLARMPVDMPVKTGLLASASVGTEKQRQAKGLDMFMPGALPLYEQGGIPAGGKILAQNYYSPFGVANDPIATGQSLIQPWLTPIVTGSLGVDWLGKPLTAPGQNTNRGNEKTPNQAERAQYIIDSVLSSFMPLYTKAAQVAEGGASPYDVTPGTGIVPPLVEGKAPATKTPGQGPLAGLRKATQPFRSYKLQTPGGSAGWSFNGAAPASSGGWSFGGSSSGSSGGWSFGP